MADKPLISQAAAARILGVHVTTVRRMVACGTLEPIRLTPNGHPRIRRADLERLCASRGVPRE